MVVLMAVAACYGVLQLGLLASGTRSIRLSTLLLVVAAGCYGSGTAALVLQLLYTRLVAAATGRPMAQVVTTASYTVDPFIEEAVKLLPLIVILLLTRRLHRQWGYVDHLLVGAASGAGFALAEALLRFSGRAARAVGDGHGGYLVPVGLSVSHVRGLGSVLTTWLPPPVALLDLFDDGQDLNFHLVWSSLAALGVGVAVRTRARRRLLALLPLLWVGVDHAAMNLSTEVSGKDAVVVLLHGTDALRAGLPALLMLALIGASVLDVRALRAVKADQPQLLLAVERSGTPSLVVLLRRALMAPPWTPLLVSRFVLSRRAAWNEVASGQPARSSSLATALAAAVEQFDWSQRRARWPRWSWSRAVLPRPAAHLLRSWRLALWLVLAFPAVLYLVVGAVPALSGVQTLMASRPVFAVLSALTAVTVVVLAWQVVELLRRLPAIVRGGASDLVLRSVSRVAAGTGAVVGGTALVARWLTGSQGTDRAVASFHILDALSLLTLVAGIALILAAAFLFPPLALVALADGGMVLVTTAVAGEFAAVATTGVALGGVGMLLSEAADANGGSGPAPGPGTPASTGAKASARKGVNLNPATRAEVQRKLPSDWDAGRPNNKKIGTRWFSPTKPKSDGVRVDKGDPGASLESQRQDHVVVRSGGDVIGPDGKPISGSLNKNPEAHIPLKDWLTWRYWWKP